MGIGLEEKSEIGIFDVNFDTGERAWSPELKELFGIPENAPPTFQSLLERVHPVDRRAFNAIAMEPFRSDCPARRTSQFRIVRDDGTVRWMHLVRMAIFRDSAAHDAMRVLGFIVETSEPVGLQRPWREASFAA